MHVIQGCVKHCRYKLCTLPTSSQVGSQSLPSVSLLEDLGTISLTIFLTHKHDFPLENISPYFTVWLLWYNS